MIKIRNGNFIVDGVDVGPTISFKVLSKREVTINKMIGVFEPLFGDYDIDDLKESFPAFFYTVEYKGKEHEYNRIFSNYSAYDYTVGEEVTLNIVKQNSSILGEWYQINAS